jgi:pimeloyl-ACP methyl ester carboxylesterase
MTVDPIDRGFVRLAEGLVHYRRVEGRNDLAPLVLLHASPGSSRGLEPLLRALAAAGHAPALIAPDTLGHGDSAPPAGADPEIGDYADATIRLLDALGIERAALYGAHTGARIACEAGVRHPDRVTQVIVDGIGEYDAATQIGLLERYAPEKVPDEYGTQMIWAFQFVRDQALHFPYYERDPAHRLMSRAVPDAETLHHAALEVLKALGSYHHAYRAAFRYPTRARLALLTQPLILLDAGNELPSLREQTKAIIGAARKGRVVGAGTTPDAKATAMLSSMQVA